MHNILLPINLLKKEESFKKSLKTKLYTFVHSFRRSKLLTKANYEKKRQEIKVEQSAMESKYESGKKGPYKSLPKEEAFKNIRRQIVRETFAKQVEKREKELSEKYKLTIKNKLLKADSI